MDIHQYYEAHRTISLSDITTDKHNRKLLGRMRDNVYGEEEESEENIELWICDEVHDDTDYAPEGSLDMGWLGYFVGKNKLLKKLIIRDFVPRSVDESFSDVLISFLKGVNSNRSIEKIDFDSFDLTNGSVFTSMDQFFKNNSQLYEISISGCNFGVEGCRSFALALGSCKSLQTLKLENNGIADEGLVDIITALSCCCNNHPYLDKLDLDGNRLSTNGCIALATLLQHSATELNSLDLSNNEINDEGIDALVPALMNGRLNSVRLHSNQHITAKGWKHFATVFGNFNIRSFYLSGNNIDDEAVTAFTMSLPSNAALENLIMNDIPITDNGWRSLKDLLCDKSSVNSTFLSNHTIKHMGLNMIKKRSLRILLGLNGSSDDKKEVAIAKVLKYHNDFDMQPFFEWEFKVLPLMLNWFKRASLIEMPVNFEPSISRRQLSSIYQFVRGMPVLYVEARLRKELEDIKALPQILLDQLSDERKRSIIEKLGLPPDT